jgi:hypothetical protein
MKNTSVKTRSRSSQLIITSDYITKNVTDLKKVRRSERSSNRVLPPTEETISTLNKLGKQYPFCVNFKQRPHDPL